jgi:UDP-glucose 6-dehydrogenase
MAGFETKNLLLTNRFYFVIIKDRFDNPKILKRITVLSRIYQKNNLKIIMVELEGKGLLKIFSNVVLADWVSYYLALKHNVNPLTNQTVEKFKKLII